MIRSYTMNKYRWIRWGAALGVGAMAWLAEVAKHERARAGGVQ